MPSSITKLHAALDDLARQPAEGIAAAGQLLLLTQREMINKALPSDPAELDRSLAAVIVWMLGLLSDDGEIAAALAPIMLGVAGAQTELAGGAADVA